MTTLSAEKRAELRALASSTTQMPVVSTDLLALLDMVEAGEWQPIETAPKHAPGKPVNAAGPFIVILAPMAAGEKPRPMIARWVGFAWDVSPTLVTGSSQGYVYSPTHWHPNASAAILALPTPPAPESGDER